METQNFPQEKLRIWKNVLIVGAAFLLHFTAYWGTVNLQSSIHSEASLGTYSLMTVYVSFGLSTIIMPSFVIRWFGCKWTMCLGLICYMPFILAQFYPMFYTMIPAGFSVGFGAGFLWCAKCIYLTTLATSYSKITNISTDIIVTRFFGVFFTFFQMSQVWGNLISSIVLSSGAATANNSSDLEVHISNNSNLCGANFLIGSERSAINPNMERPSVFKINLIAFIYLSCMVIASSTIAIFADSQARYQNIKTKETNEKSSLELLKMTIKQLANVRQILILPIITFIGAEQAFLFADFSASFVSCGWGISNIGFVMICFGISNAISSLCFGILVKITGRRPIIAFGLMLHLGVLIYLLYWQPSKHDTYMYFAAASLWGVCDAVWLVQINSLNGILFPGKEQAAFSNFRLWYSVGTASTYAINPYLKTGTKTMVLIALLVTGVLGYICVEHSVNKVKHVETNHEMVHLNGHKKDHECDNDL